MTISSKMLDTFKILFILLAAAAITTAFLASESSGHSGHSFSAAALVTPTINGTKDAGEWDDADCQTNQVRADNGDISNLTICVKNDETNLYMAVEASNQDYSDPSEPCFDFLTIGFDDNHNGTIEGSAHGGEDGIALSFDGSTLYDMFNPGVVFGYQSDGIDNGTNDVAAAITHSNPGPNTIGTYTSEYAHPLNSADDAHDFSLRYGDTISFNFKMSDGDPSPTRPCVGPYGSFEWPSRWPIFSPGWADITIATPIPADALPVEISIQPGGNPNSINCEAKNKIIAVAILTTDDFDATAVDQATVIFEGASEIHADPKTGDLRRHEEDADGDSDIDLVLHFRLEDTRLSCRSTRGILVGETFSGQTITGSGEVDMIQPGK